MSRKGLIIFAREPLPGKVKTRLAASIGDAAAAGLYEAMLQDVLAISRKIKDVETMVFWDCEESGLQPLADRYRCSSRRQADGDLGQRMQAAFTDMFDNGFEQCCIIGSDIPDLPSDYIKEAFDLLTAEKADSIFGPSADGGYYLLGLTLVIPQLFTNIKWSTPLVLRQSLEAAREAGATTALLPVWHDIDTREDLNSFMERSTMLFPEQTKTAAVAAAL